MIRPILFFSAALASGAAAQIPPQSAPGLGNYSLPASEPTPAPTPTATVTSSPVPSPTPTPTVAPTPVAALETTPRAIRTPRIRRTSRARSTVPSTSVEQSTATPSPTPSAVAPTPSPSAPAARPPEPPAPEPHAGDFAAWWPWLAGAAALLLLAGAWALRRRRFRGSTEVEPLAEPAPAMPPAPEPVAPAARLAPVPTREPAMLSRPPTPALRPLIDLAIHPRRGGLNLLSATVEVEITLRNTGEAAAEAVLVEAALLPARAGLDGELGALFAHPAGRPIVPAFALAPGEERRVRIVTALPLAGLEPLVARGRPMLVPVVAIKTSYRWAGETGQTAAAIVVGVERDGQDKLAPFWLDAPRMHDQLAARPHGFSVRR